MTRLFQLLAAKSDISLTEWSNLFGNFENLKKKQNIGGGEGGVGSGHPEQVRGEQEPEPGTNVIKLFTSVIFVIS